MEDKYKDLIEKTISSETAFRGRVFDVVLKKVELSDGKIANREVVIHNGGACILPIDDDMNCYMVRQFRSPFERVMLEVPAGKIEKGEEPYNCAVRELREETGFEASEITSLGSMICSPGYDSEIIYLYAARGLKYIGDDPDDGEFLKCDRIPLEELLRMADNGEINDSKTMLCIYKAVRRFGN